MQVSLWSNIKNGEYEDKIISETDDTMVVKYFGQKHGVKDKLISSGNAFFYKINKSSYYNYVGQVKEITYADKENGINVFILVIQKDQKELKFRIKNDACNHFGWELMNRWQVLSGIIQH